MIQNGLLHAPVDFTRVEETDGVLVEARPVVDSRLVELRLTTTTQVTYLVFSDPGGTVPHVHARGGPPEVRLTLPEADHPPREGMSQSPSSGSSPFLAGAAGAGAGAGLATGAGAGAGFFASGLGSSFFSTAGGGVLPSPLG